MVSKRFHHNKPPTILDVPVNMQWEALDIADPETPVGARGIGEPPVGGGCASILVCSDAAGDEIFQRAGERGYDFDFAGSWALTQRR